MSDRSDLGAMFRFHHTGVVVKSIPEVVHLYEKLGYEVSEPVYDAEQNVWLAACHMDGHLLELVAPKDEDSPCMLPLRKSGPGPYHVCYRCDSIEEAKSAMKANGFRFTVSSKTKPTTLFENAEVTFLYVLKVGLIELIAYGDSPE